MKKIAVLMGSFAFAAGAAAEEAVAAVANAGGMSNSAIVALSAAIVMGIAAFGGALGQAKIGSAAMEGIARNPQARQDMFVPMIIGLALIESLVIYALVIAFQLVGKV